MARWLNMRDWWRNDRKPEPPPTDTTSLLLAQALTELGEARKDLARVAEQAQATLDRVVGARYDRPAPQARRSSPAPVVSPLALADDSAFFRSLESQFPVPEAQQ